MTVTYNVYRDGEKIASNITTNSYTDENLKPNSEYTYQISASNSAGESELSEKIVVKTNYSPVTSVSLNKNQMELVVGEEEVLTATVSPKTSLQDVEWHSDDNEVATVNNSGRVVAVGAGETTISATSVSDNTKKDECVVSVSVEEETEEVEETEED